MNGNKENNTKRLGSNASRAVLFFESPRPFSLSHIDLILGIWYDGNGHTKINKKVIDSMEQIICKSCGGNSFKKSGNIRECEFCGSTYTIESDNTVVDETLTDAKLVQYYLEASKYQNNNDFSGELKVLTQALELNPNNPLTLVKVGRCYRNLNLHNEAIKMYKRAIAIDPKTGTAYTNIGTICLLNQNWSEASTYYQKGLPLIDKGENDYWVGYANYAIAIAKLGDPKKAEQMIAEAESHGYKNGDGCRKMAGIQKSSGSTGGNGGCYVATCVYGSYDCPQVWTLRRYRDDTLAATWYGRAFIHTYYAISPTIVKWFGETQWFQDLWKSQLDKMVSKLQHQGVEATPYQDKNW